MDLSDENPLTPLSSESNKFWTTYNYLMDTNLIDSCYNKPNTPPKEPENISKSKFSLNSVPNSTNQPFRSQRLSHESLRRLRRWLNEMEKRFALAPTLSDAMKLNKKELQKYLTIHADLYKEIVSKERPVAFCIRSITDCNLFESTATDILDQQSSLKSENSEKDNNLGKALQRRYHLIYLKAIEVQCMLEGLLEKRKKIQSMAMSMNSSDEEPHHKIAKFKHKSNGKEMPMDYQKSVTTSSMMIESSSGNDTGPNESDSPIEFDVKSFSSISKPNLFSDTSCGFENTAEISSSSQSLIVETITNFQQTNRKSINCGTFYYEFKDDESVKTEIKSSVVKEPTKSLKSKDQEPLADNIKVCKESNNTLLVNAWDFMKIPVMTTDILPFELVSPRMEIKHTPVIKKFKSLTEAINSQNFSKTPIKTVDSSDSDVIVCESMQKLRKRRKKMIKNSTGSDPKSPRNKEPITIQAIDTTQTSYFDSPNISAILNTSNISEPAWDDYVKNYDTDIFSENDFEEVRNSLEFGNDYREFLDSLSESCSSSVGSNISLPDYLKKFEEKQFHRENIKRMIDECEPMQIDSEEAVKHKEKMMNGSNNTKYLTAEDYVEIVEICRKNIECLERVLKDPSNTTHENNSNDLNKECHCARITKFIAFCLDFLLDVKNYVTNTTLYKFLSKTVKGFFAIIRYVRRKAESFVDRLCRRLATF